LWFYECSQIIHLNYETMKYAAAFITAFLFFACASPSIDSEKIQSTNDHLISSIQDKNSQINTLLQSIKDIKKNLEKAKNQQGIILTAHSNYETPLAMKESIIDDIELLHQLIEDSKWDIEDLEKNLNRKSAKNEELKMLLSSLKENIKQRDKEIFQMKEELYDWDAAYGLLSEELDLAVVSNDLLTDEMNRVYFTCGTFKELRDKGVVHKKGSLLGIGGNKDLSNDFSKTHFNEVDLRLLKSIPINARKLEIVTPHDDDSYYIELNEEGLITELVILDQDRFWGKSKYLTVVIKP